MTTLCDWPGEGWSLLWLNNNTQHARVRRREQTRPPVKPLRRETSVHARVTLPGLTGSSQHTIVIVFLALPLYLKANQVPAGEVGHCVRG